VRRAFCWLFLIATLAAAFCWTRPGAADSPLTCSPQSLTFPATFGSDTSTLTVRFTTASDVYTYGVDVSPLVVTRGDGGVWTVFDHFNVGPLETREVKVTFRPTAPIHYHALVDLHDSNHHFIARLELDGSGTDTLALMGDLWWDRNDNGIREPGEPCAGGVVSLRPAGGGLERTAHSSGCGDSPGYRFYGLKPGDYLLSVRAMDDPCLMPGPAALVHLSPGAAAHGRAHCELPVLSSLDTQGVLARTTARRGPE
jgi:hypothetical protein